MQCWNTSRHNVKQYTTTAWAWQDNIHPNLCSVVISDRYVCFFLVFGIVCDVHDWTPIYLIKQPNTANWKQLWCDTLLPQYEISNHSSIYYATIPCMPCIIYHMIPYQPIACTFVTIYFYNNNNIAPWRCNTAPFNCNTVITTPPSKPYHVPSDRTPHRTLRPYPTPYHRTFRTLVWTYLI